MTSPAKLAAKANGQLLVFARVFYFLEDACCICVSHQAVSRPLCRITRWVLFSCALFIGPSMLEDREVRGSEVPRKGAKQRIQEVFLIYIFF